MDKVKKLMDPKVLTILIAVSVFVGWQYSLLLSVAVFVLCDDEEVKSLLIKTLIFSAGILLIHYGWEVIESIIGLVFGVFKDFFNYLYTLEIIDDFEVIQNIDKFFFIPVNSIVALAGKILNIAILVGEFAYVTEILTYSKKGFIVGFINKVTGGVYNKLMNIAPQQPMNNMNMNNMNNMNMNNQMPQQNNNVPNNNGQN